jgi:hypothetical protein
MPLDLNNSLKQSPHGFRSKFTQNGILTAGRSGWFGSSAWRRQQGERATPASRIRRLPRVSERDSGSRSGRASTSPSVSAAFRYDPYPSSKHGLNSFFFLTSSFHRLIRRPATAHRVPSPSPPPAITSGSRGHAEPELLRPPRGALPRDRAQAAEGTDRGSRLWKSLRGGLEGALAALSDLLRCRFRAPGLLGFRQFVFCAGDLRLGGSRTVGFRRGFMRIHSWAVAAGVRRGLAGGGGGVVSL